MRDKDKYDRKDHPAAGAERASLVRRFGVILLVGRLITDCALAVGVGRICPRRQGLSPALIRILLMRLPGWAGMRFCWPRLGRLLR